MSNRSTFDQAAHTLTLIGQQGPSLEDLKVLHDGYLTDLMLAIKGGKIPAREDFRKSLGLGPLVLPKPDFKVWRTVKYSGKDATAYRKSFKQKGINIGIYADQILDKIKFPVVGAEMDIVRTNGAQMYFDKATRRDTIYERALGFGLEKLEPWAALEARDDYLDQPKGEWLRAGMEPIVDSDRGPRLFYLVRYDVGLLWLCSGRGNADLGWNPDDAWLFGLPRK